MKQKILHLGLVLAALLMMVGCSGNGSSMLNKIPANSDFVFVGDIKLVIESAGGEVSDTKIKLPSAIEALMGSSEMEEFDEINSVLKNSGVDVKNFAVAGKYKDGYPMIIIKINDSNKFVKTIEDNGFDEKEDEDGLVIYAKKTYESSYDSSWDDYTYIGICDGYAYIVSDVWKGSDFKPLKAMPKFIESANEESFGSTPMADYITSGNVGGCCAKIPREIRNELGPAAAVIGDFIGGSVCFTGALDGESATIKCKFFDADNKPMSGNIMSEFMDVNARISSSALKYLNDNEQLVYAMALKDVNWSRYLNLLTNQMSSSERRQLQPVIDGLKNVDGTLALGVGIENGIDSFINMTIDDDTILEEMIFTLVVEFKDGKAKSAFNEIKEVLDEDDVDVEISSNSITIEVDDDIYIYVKCEDNYMIISNNKISDSNSNTTVKSIKFTDYPTAIGLCLDKNCKLMEDLNLNYDITSYIVGNVKDFESEFTVTVKGGGNKGVLAKFIDIATDIYGQSGNISDRYSSRREKYWENYWGNYLQQPTDSVEEVVEVVEADDYWEY